MEVGLERGMMMGRSFWAAMAWGRGRARAWREGAGMGERRTYARVFESKKCFCRLPINLNFELIE